MRPRTRTSTSSTRRIAGRATGSILLLLALLAGAGAWNYHRNLQIERATEGNRPYESYAAADLAALREAYAGELAGMRSRFDQARLGRVRPRGDVGSISGNVAQFQQTARASSAIRDAAAGVADREAQIAELDRELSLRENFGEGFKRHLNRLIRI